MRIGKIKKIRRILMCAVLALLMIGVMTTVSCGTEEETIELVELAGWQEYVIVRPDGGDRVETDAAIKLKNAIEERVGVTLTLTTDWVKRGEEAPTDTKEILIGSTNRPESDITLLYHDIAVEASEHRVAIIGGSPEATDLAVDWFIENCIAETVSVPAERYVKAGEYPLRNVSIGGVPLYEYAVNSPTLTDDTFPDEKAALRLWLAEMTGHYPENDGEHYIRVETGKEIGITEVVNKLDGGDIVLTVAAGGMPIDDAITLFKTTLENRNEDEVNIEMTQTADIDNIKTCDAAQIAEWRKMTDERIEDIINTPNMEIPEGAKVYYVSNNGDDSNDGRTPETAVKTLFRASNLSLREGDYVCFERGGVWRGNLSALKGVTYTAYGEGDKPKLYGSPEDGADPAKWTKTDAENVWSYDAWDMDVGTLVFNHGEAHAVKYIIRTKADGSTVVHATGKPFKDYHDLTEDLTFWHDVEGKKLYLYSEINPGERFDSIEFNVKKNIIQVHGPGVTIDNLCIMYGGAHGVSSGTTQNLTVQNCVFGWMGGSLQKVRDDGVPVRYGNGVEIYGGCDGYTVQNNYFFQIYDAAVTHQVSLSSTQVESGTVLNQKNILYAGNVMEYCNYSIEYFLGNVPEDNPSRMENFVIEDNYMWYAAEGFCEQRPDKNAGCHIKGWSHNNRAVDYVIRNNLMLYTKDMLVDIYSNRLNPDGSDSMPTLENNQFAAFPGVSFGVLKQDDNTRAPYNASVVDYTAEHSNGDTFWFIAE
ncbi:MAG: hypothetical protein IJ493_05970 [Clostridia bacterium]|nr:hypothetical protein [Clostridia bacterium]